MEEPLLWTMRSTLIMLRLLRAAMVDTFAGPPSARLRYPPTATTVTTDTVEFHFQRPSQAHVRALAWSSAHSYSIRVFLYFSRNSTHVPVLYPSYSC